MPQTLVSTLLWWVEGLPFLWIRVWSLSVLLCSPWPRTGRHPVALAERIALGTI